METGKGIRVTGRKLAQNTEVENMKWVQEKKNCLKLIFHTPIEKLWRPQTM